jgi:hypothetical protein
MANVGQVAPLGVALAIAAVALSSIVHAVAGQRVPYGPALRCPLVVGAERGFSPCSRRLPIY